MPDYFALGDTDKDGYIEYKEFCVLFDTFDVSSDTTKVNTKHG